MFEETASTGWGWRFRREPSAVLRAL